MDTPAHDVSEELVELTSEIVSAYVMNNRVATTELPGVIASVHAALAGLDKDHAKEPEKPTPIVSVKRSITPDYLISLEDGRRYKSLKRHLSGRGLTPAEYREKWGLAKDYPMVAPNYAKQRSELAKALGLGQQRRKRGSASADGAAPLDGQARAGAPSAEITPRRRGRPRTKKPGEGDVAAAE